MAANNKAEGGYMKNRYFFIWQRIFLHIPESLYLLQTGPGCYPYNLRYLLFQKTHSKFLVATWFDNFITKKIKS